jgi:hypothetical protein
MEQVTHVGAGHRRVLLVWYAAATVLAVFTYFYGLDSEHIPKNGDEYPYEHITRTTAASGEWLPLQSELPEMRNTKPPLLFWQGIASTSWGRDWTLWNLRWPSVMYTLCTAAMVFMLAWKSAGAIEAGFVGLLTFLAFFSTYRYGRPFLTDPPSVFWLFTPCFALLYWRRVRMEPGVTMPLALGLTTGIGLLYKSFALLLPVAAWLSWVYLRERRYRVGAFLKTDTVKIVVIGVVSLAVFGLWFVLDPDPRAILDEFVLKENAGKFGTPGDYFTNLLWGGSSIWRLVASYPLNAGLLMFPVVALFVSALKRRFELSDSERLLWMWVAAFFIVFSLPSQRDERYLLPAMPAVAVLCAINWERIDLRAFKASLVFVGVAVLLAGYLSLRLEQGVPGGRLFSFGYWALVVVTAVVALAPLIAPRLVRPCVNVAILLGLTMLAGFFRPFDGAAGTYDAHAQSVARGQAVWVPVNFVAKEEGHRFLLPGADVRGYALDSSLTTDDLAARYPMFAVSLPMTATGVSGGSVIGQRLDIRTRHSTNEILEMLRGRVYENLFVKEVLVESATRPASTTNDVKQ